MNINEDNLNADPRPALQGDTPKAGQSAVNRASWIWLKGMQLAHKPKKSLGVGRCFYRATDIEIQRLEPEDDSAAEMSELNVYFASKQENEHLEPICADDEVLRELKEQEWQTGFEAMGSDPDVNNVEYALFAAQEVLFDCKNEVNFLDR